MDVRTAVQATVGGYFRAQRFTSYGTLKLINYQNLFAVPFVQFSPFYDRLFAGHCRARESGQEGLKRKRGASRIGSGGVGHLTDRVGSGGVTLA